MPIGWIKFKILGINRLDAALSGASVG